MATTTIVNWVKSNTSESGIVYNTDTEGYRYNRIVRCTENRRVFRLYHKRELVTTGTLSQCQAAAVYEEPASYTTTGRIGSGNHKAQIGGYSATSVLRWMGSQGWNWREAVAVLEKLDITMKETTIKLQINSGRHGNDGWYGKVPEIDPTLVSKLNKLRKTN